MDPIAFLMVVVLVTGLVLGALMPLLVVKLHRRGKACVVWVDPDARSVSIGYHKPHDGRIVREGRTYLLDGLAKHGGKVSTWIMDPRLGWSYRAPTRAENMEAGLAVLEPSNPESYHRALHRHSWNEILLAGDDSDRHRWVFPVALVGLVALVVIVGLLGWVVTRLPAPAGGG